jgi:hypothetical protein
MGRRTGIPVPPDPGGAEEAAKAAAAAKADRAPHTLSDAEVMLLPGARVLDLGNAGHLRHLGLGLPVPVPKEAAKRAPGAPERPMVSDVQLARMTGDQVRRAVTAGRVPGIGARRRTWGQR